MDRELRPFCTLC